jgi:hypothetical protein
MQLSSQFQEGEIFSSPLKKPIYGMKKIKAFDRRPDREKTEKWHFSMVLY